MSKIGCWNCDSTYSITIKKGITVPEYILGFDPECKKCGCRSLKPFDEYKTEKEIFKELVLHHKLEQIMGDGKEIKDDHRHIG